MRAVTPDIEGFVERDGAKIAYQVFENPGKPTVFLGASWMVVDSRHWKMQIPYLSRHFRVVTFDPVGNGKSDRSTDSKRFGMPNDAADAIAVLDATGTKTCVAVGLSAGGRYVHYLAGLYPDRFDAIIGIAPAHLWASFSPGMMAAYDMFEEVVENAEGWDTQRRSGWINHWEDYVAFFATQCASDPHSTKLVDDMTEWMMGTTGPAVVAETIESDHGDLEKAMKSMEQIDIPILIIHGTADQLVNYESAAALKALHPQAEVLTIDGAGHLPQARYPVRVNHAMKSFVDRVYGLQEISSVWHVGHARPKKVLYVSSPIGLGHARRDVAIAQELRGLHPDIEIDWLAQDPVTRVLDASGERIHPASEFLANESSHIESEAGEHNLEVFQALRDMDEILIANFMVTEEVIRDGQYDLVIGDEAWELDGQLHENPNLKSTPFAWMTDFVGYIPMPERGEREAFVAADYNLDMIEQVARYQRVRDAAIFVGNPDDIGPQTFGPGLPGIRDWTEENFDFSGYVTGFDPKALGDRQELRQELGYLPDQKVCIVSVGGSAVGTHLLNRVVNSYEAASQAIDDLRMIVVTGPRIDPATLPQIPGVEFHAYVDKLYRHLAVADLAIVQGGLTTTMELAASKVPFIYVPLRGHFEQNFHVRARLDKYRAGRYVDYEDVVPDNLSAVMVEEMGRPVDYLDVETDGAKTAAGMIGNLL